MRKKFERDVRPASTRWFINVYNDSPIHVNEIDNGRGNQCISSSTKIFFRSDVGFLNSNNVCILIMHMASNSLFEMEIPSILVWQILRFDPKDMKLRFAVLRRRFLVFNGGPMRLATNFTLVTAQNTRKIDFFFGSEKVFNENSEKREHYIC
jgi:hypothetical protein